MKYTCRQFDDSFVFQLVLCGVSSFLFWEKRKEKEETVVVSSPRPSYHGRSEHSHYSRYSHRDFSPSSQITTTTPVDSHTAQLKITKDKKEITITPVSGHHSKHSAHSFNSNRSKHSYIYHSSSRHSQKPAEVISTTEVDPNTALKIKKQKNEVTITPVSAHQLGRGSKHSPHASHHDTKDDDGHQKSLFSRLVHSHHSHDSRDKHDSHRHDTHSIPATAVVDNNTSIKVKKKKNEITISPVSSRHK